MITRPSVLTEEEAQEMRQAGARIYQSPHDPRVSWVINWALGILAALLTAGGIGAFSVLLTMRDQIATLTQQVVYMQRQITDLREEVRDRRP